MNVTPEMQTVISRARVRDDEPADRSRRDQIDARVRDLLDRWGVDVTDPDELAAVIAGVILMEDLIAATELVMVGPMAALLQRATVNALNTVASHASVDAVRGVASLPGLQR